jgi:TetR/AcrR family transcriptional regulator
MAELPPQSRGNPPDGRCSRASSGDVSDLTDADPVGGPNRTGNYRRILEVAIREFAAKGMAGTRVAEIAKQANVNKQLLYYYFGSKAELLGAAHSDMVAVARSLIVDSSRGSFRTRMLATITPAEIDRRRTLRRLWLWEALELGDTEILREAERREAWERAVDMVRSAQERGEIDRSLDPAMVMLAVDAIINSPFALPQVTKLITGLDPDSEEFRQDLRRFAGRLLTALGPRE